MSLAKAIIKDLCMTRRDQRSPLHTISSEDWAVKHKVTIRQRNAVIDQRDVMSLSSVLKHIFEH